MSQSHKKKGSNMKHSFLILIMLFVVLQMSNSQAQWANDPTINNAICTSANDQTLPQLISDGSGGAIIVWQDLNDIYA